LLRRSPPLCVYTNESLVHRLGRHARMLPLEKSSSAKKQAPLSGGFLNYFLPGRPWEKWIFPAAVALSTLLHLIGADWLTLQSAVQLSVWLANGAQVTDSLPRMHFHLTAFLQTKSFDAHFSPPRLLSFCRWSGQRHRA